MVSLSLVYLAALSHLQGEFCIDHWPIWQQVNWRSGASPFPFKRGEKKIRELIDSVVVEGRAVPLPYSRNLAAVASGIKERIDPVLRSAQPRLSQFEREWLTAEAVCEWVRVHVYYDSEIERLSGDESVHAAEPATILGRRQPGAVCFGFAWLTRDIARASGLKCDVVNGTFRGLKNPAPTEPNHSVVCFVFDGGIEVPADVSSARGTYARPGVPGPEGLRKVPARKVESRYILPRTAEAAELFCVGFFARLDPVQRRLMFKAITVSLPGRSTNGEASTQRVCAASWKGWSNKKTGPTRRS